jgi:glutamate 5-kinase
MDAVTGTASAALLAKARRIVVKIGSALLVDQSSGTLRDAWLNGLAADVADLKAQGRDVLLVSSGSIALGRRILKLPAGPLALEQSQAAAAVGQIRLAQAYAQVLAPHGIIAAQVLVTLEDTENRRRYLNARATLAALLDMGTVPIVNENDTVATDEIRYGDNDRLAAQVAALTGADVTVLLSDVDGLYTADPRRDPGARHLPVVERITPEIEAMAGGAAGEHSRGGMRTKVLAARMATQAGGSLAVTLGAVDRPLSALRGAARATWFLPDGDPRTARKLWISAMKPKGTIRVDAGAVAALARGRSLLPAGVTAVEGSFGRGDPVDIAGPDGAVLARALAGYDAAEAALIAGLQSRDIAARLGHPGRAALIHRDDMAI